MFKKEDLQIVIFSTGRPDNQITFNNIPKKYHENTMILTYHDENQEYRDKTGFGNCIGVHPFKVSGIAEKREFVAKNYGRGKLLFMLDDDLGFIKAKRNNLTGEFGPFLKFEPTLEEDFDNLIKDIFTLSDIGFKVGGLGQRVAPTGIASYPMTMNSRVWTNTWLDFRGYNHRPEQYDWTGYELGFDRENYFLPEDFHIQAQATLEGYPVISLQKWNVNGNKTQAAGGCSTSPAKRTVSNHNNGMELFTKVWNERVPGSVKLRYKDSWEKDTQKAAITLYLSKVWKYTMGNKADLMDPWITRYEQAREILGGYSSDRVKPLEKAAYEQRKRDQELAMQYTHNSRIQEI